MVAESLIEADLCGHDSHGVMRLLEYVAKIDQGDLAPNADLLTVRETASVLVCDAQRGFGQIQCRRFTDRAIEKALQEGVCSGVMRNCGHVGRLGEWVERAAARDCAALMSVNDNGTELCVAPPGAAEGRLGTNPIAIAAPTDENPAVLDMSTSVVASGKVTVRRLAGQPCPEGWLQDANGAPTTDPNVLSQSPPGTLLPLGGYKGFGLSLLLDMLVGGLSGGCSPSSDGGPAMTNNILLLVWSPEKFAGRDHFVRTAQALVDFVRGAAVADSTTGPRIPGDRSREIHAARLRDGLVLDRGAWLELQSLAERLGAQVPDPTLSRDEAEAEQ